MDFCCIDLHSHSTASDGTYSPEDLVVQAYELGVRLFAVTDHDTLAGYMSINQANLPSDFRLVSGVEISTMHALSGGYGRHEKKDKVIHIVALNIRQIATLEQWLSAIQNSRANRGRAMVQKLSDIFSQIDNKVLWQKVLDKALGNEHAVGRVHIAQTLHELGLVKSVQDAFDKYLADNKFAYVAIETPTMIEAIAQIHACGGFAVLAHPTRYGLSATRVRRLIADFAEAGGDAVELPNGEPASTRAMIDRCIKEHGLMVSLGSDFHGTTMPWRKLGKTAIPHDHQAGIWTKFE